MVFRKSQHCLLSKSSALLASSGPASSVVTSSGLASSVIASSVTASSSLASSGSNQFPLLLNSSLFNKFKTELKKTFFFFY